MTENKTINNLEQSKSDFHKLSIQISLNGLSFCVLDTVDNHILASENVVFEREVNPLELLKKVKEIFDKYKVAKAAFSEVIAIHKNQLFSLVPKALFDEGELANYLKFNAKMLTNDIIVYDELEGNDLMNVYVPFMNVNNYIYELFGEFEFKHSSTVMVESLLNTPNPGNDAVCYVHVGDKQLDITVVSNKKLQLHNSFDYNTKEDFIYYLLFTIEQLKLDPNTVKLKLFGAIDEDDEIYGIAYDYIKNISIFIPSNIDHITGNDKDDAIDFTVLKTL
ncbi:hypothetical protein SB49_02025 [Sediminicola sp. YIK13]|uniref:DUF3822 family protein n=1 Tax=Sediminicola sp. YIK13 TaxID=1453352 RepID=UPI00071F5E09|nr:DUF3822 family protein [Sediminicola sp. YIK13]ALM06718.1 hypothetical protein SB49_02025 [Sediminicola sp. YIK13]